MPADLQSSPGRERELFLGLVAIADPLKREAFLTDACGHDHTLRRRLVELWDAQTDLGGFLEEPALADTWPRPSTQSAHSFQTLPFASGAERPGDAIGPYKLLQQIGEGGCGIVYMAEQEKPVRRRVALKVIRLGMDTKGVIARFEAERQALAMMDHPNIARVLDAGATEAGRPYFVMELVRGVRITDYCDQNNLTTQARLRLFIQVCQAIQHAHQKGIIHRDIKPSNILVTLHDSTPVPKVIDFGIAKATERLTDKTLFTEFTAFIGTPAYMSPEQAQMSGLDIDTRSDIYSLGVLLYELLIGRTPFDAETLHRAGLDECRRTIRETEPARPSTRLASLPQTELTTTAQQRRIEPPRLAHLLRGDLDWIAMKCLEKDRTRRYATANDLAEDIQRQLDGEPVLARPPSNVYRLQKLLHRHRGAFAAVAASAAILLVGIAVSTWQAVRATRAEHRAQSAKLQEASLRRDAEIERARAEQEKAAAHLNEYVADINLTQQALKDGNYGRAVQLLHKHVLKPGEPDLRGFEWRHLWQLSRGDEHQQFPSQPGPVQGLAISPSGNLLAIGWRDRCHVWNLQTKSLITTIHKGGVSLFFSPDGQRLFSTSPTTARIWNTRTWTEEKSLPENAAPIALSTDGSRLATASRDGIRVWDTASWNEIQLLPDAFGPISFAPNAGTLAAATADGIVLWPLDGTRSELLLQNSTNLFKRGPPWSSTDRIMAFSPDGRSIVVARNTLFDQGVFVLSVWDARTGQEIAVIPDDPHHIEHTGVISCMAFSPDGHTLATASQDHSIRLWDLKTRRPVGAFQGHLSEVWSLVFSPDGRTLISGAKDGEIKIWPIQEERKEEILTLARQTLAFSKDGRTLVGLSRDASVVFIDLATGEAQKQFPLERGRFRGPFGPPIALSDDLHTLAEGLDDGTVKLINTQTRQSTTLKVCDGRVDLVELSPDGETLITRGRDWVCRRWDLRAGTNIVWRVDAFKVLYSPDGRTLATLSPGRPVRLWEASTLLPRARLSVEEPPTLSATFSSDSQLLAVCYQDATIRLWEVASGNLRGVCNGHKQDVWSAAFAPDGKTLATTSEDNTLKLWNVATQQELLTIRRLGGPLRGLLFSPHGQLLAGATSGSASGGLLLYRAPLLSEIDARGQN